MVRCVGWRELGVVIAALAIAASIAACGGSDDQAKAKEEMKIALLLPNDRAARYWGRAGFQKKVVELCHKQCKLSYGNAQDSATRQQSQAERALSEGADVLVVDSVEPATASRIVQKARASSVPVISYVRLIPNADVDYHVGVNEEGLGELQAELLLTKLKEDERPQGPVVFLASDSGDLQDASARKTIDSGGVKVASESGVGDLSHEAAFGPAKHEMSRAIDALGPDGFVGVLAPDDEAAAGAIAAMKANGIDPRKKLTVGAGSDLPAVKRVLVGEQYASAYEANWEVRSAAVRAAVRLAKGDGVPAAWITDKLANGSRDVPAILLQPTAVTAENLMSTVIPYGFITPKELCVGPYARYCAEAPVPIR